MSTDTLAAPPRIEVNNMGPIGHFELVVEDYGITTIYSPNGRGKSLLADAIKKAQRGEGAVPLKDHAKRGKVEAFGATITIGGTCRHTGENERPHVEGRFDIGALIDPPFKGDKERNAAGIKALLALTGKKAAPDAFRGHEAFADTFGEVVKVESLETDDFVEMARRIKRDYDNKAKELEAEAEREDGKAAALGSHDGLDLKAECDEQVLQDAYNAARDEKTRLESAKENFDGLQAAADEARSTLEALKAKPAESMESIDLEIEGAKNQVAAEGRLIADLKAKISKLQDELYEANRRRDRSIELINEDISIGPLGSLIKRREAAASHVESVEAAERAIAKLATTGCPSPEALEKAQRAMDAAKAAQEQGTLIRQAKKDAENSAKHRSQASAARDKALKLRDAGKATDEVLSAAIECPVLRVESDGKSAVLVTDTDRGKGIPFYELSHGQRGKIAIAIGAERIAEAGSGVLVIDQERFDGLDSWARKEIHDEAVRLEQYVLAFEALRDTSVEVGIRRVELKG